MSLLELERVSKAFGGVRAINDVSLSLGEGELVGVMGPNGSGKSTLFNVIAGALPVEHGTIRFDGRNVTGWTAHRMCRAGVARTFQLVRPFGGLTVRDNVRIGALYGRARASRSAADVDRLLALVGLDAKGERHATELTLIERKQLELARALATGPRLLMLDEFMAGLNPSEIETAMTLIRRLAADGVTILMIEHIVWALLDLAARIVVLSAGEKIADGPPRDVVADPTVLAVYLGRDAKAARGA